MNSKNNSQMIFSSEDIKDLVKKTKGIDFRELNQQRKKALQMDKEELLGNFKIASTIDIESLVKPMKLAPKVSDIISKNDIQQLSNQVFQQYNFSKTIQQSVIDSVSISKIRLDTTSDTYKINTSNKEVIKDYTPLFDYAIKWNERIAFGIDGGYSMYSIVYQGVIPIKFLILIHVLHFIIAWVLVEAKNKHEIKLEQNEKE
ncbi:hypothetical protein SOJ_17710 [Staphylococcus sp. OJ82]|uniref:hypothetical protein n=1 Tax=Staphylococcus sp. OJ82 TaxID=1202667 RepID=UPI000281DB43|nr:hypothetical protein [Staphylococcus sp. OJ82]EJX17482.1 hypothetical protein SOJ_17710 [Staphylococcus sp. OJ82]